MQRVKLIYSEEALDIRNKFEMNGRALVKVVKVVYIEGSEKTEIIFF